MSPVLFHYQVFMDMVLKYYVQERKGSLDKIYGGQGRLIFHPVVVTGCSSTVPRV